MDAAAEERGEPGAQRLTQQIQPTPFCECLWKSDFYLWISTNTLGRN